MPPLRARTGARLRAAQVGQGQAETAAYHCAGLRDADRRASQDGDAGGRRLAGDGNGGRSLDHRVPPVGALFAGRLAFVGGHRPRLGGGPRFRRSDPRLSQHHPRRDLGRERRGAGLAAALRPPRALARGHGARRRAVPHRRRRYSEGPHRGRCLGLGPGPGELADRPHRHRGRARAHRALGRARPAALTGLAARGRRVH